MTHLAAIEELNAKLAAVRMGGGAAAVKKHKEKGKMTARERIEYLLDEPNAAVEIGALAADGMYAEEGGCP
ncbi:MAG: acyl-CoA carboxylase subunit beta, partial [Bacteroidia bacterium]|nr:acyl-CoA carboxylase subunit beta [Bacteroidia bacterium]MDW8335160.1 acyl-CoA carboxylase subunit beta [Bacteroidia bacterium]